MKEILPSDIPKLYVLAGKSNMDGYDRRKRSLWNRILCFFDDNIGYLKFLLTVKIWTNMKNISYGLPDDICEIGFYFKIGYRHFVIHEIKGEADTSCQLSVSEIGIPQDHNGEIIVKSGDQVLFDQHDMSTDLWFKLNIWGKYYFPEFKPGEVEYQWDHNYGDGGDKSQIQVFCEAMEYALKFGMEKYNIKPY